MLRPTIRLLDTGETWEEIELRVAEAIHRRGTEFLLAELRLEVAEGRARDWRWYPLLVREQAFAAAREALPKPLFAAQRCGG
jgi:hypothetical protein